MSTITASTAAAGQVTRPTERVICALACLAAMLFLRSPFDGNGDTAWLIITAEHMLDGRVLYRDILEVNPPMSALIYLAPVWLARETGLPAELAVHGLLIAFSAILLMTAWRLATACAIGTDRSRLLLIIGLAFATLILPSRCFAQREHVALIGLAVYVLVSVARSMAGQMPISQGWDFLAGIAGGIAICIKPHFVLVLALVHAWLLLSAWRQGWRPASVADVWLRAGVGLQGPLAALTLVIYLASIAVIFPAFWTDMYPLVRDAYLPFRLTAVELVAVPAGSIGLAAIGLLIWLLAQRASALSGAFAAAAVGALLVFCVQGKGWGYHQLPTFGFVAMSLAAHLASRAPGGLPRARMAPLLGLATVLGVLAPMELDRHDKPRALEAAIKAIGAHQSILIASSNLGLHFPLVRRVKGEWVGRMPSLWITNGAGQMLAAPRPPVDVSRLRQLMQLDLDLFVTDAVTRRPNLLGFAEHNGASARSWALSDARMSVLLADYTYVGSFDDVALYRLNTGG